MRQDEEWDAGLNSADFLARLATRDREAIADLYRRAHKPLIDYLRRTRKRHGVPASEWLDVLQDMFVKFLHKCPAFDPQRKIGPFLRTVVFNEAVDRARERSRRSEVESLKGLAQLRAAAGAETISPLVGSEQRTLVDSKLQTMAAPDQQALREYLDAGPRRHVASLAAKAGLTTGAAQMRFQRAKEKLAILLRDMNDRRDDR